MTDKNWKDTLRQGMSEYKETPPEGLWEALEASGAVGGKTASGAGKAGAGLFAWLFGNRAPVRWAAVAGVAAAAAAVLLVVKPGATRNEPVLSSDLLASNELREPSAADEPALQEPEPSGVQQDVSTLVQPSGRRLQPQFAEVQVSEPKVSEVSSEPSAESGDRGTQNEAQTAQEGDKRQDAGDSQPVFETSSSSGSTAVALSRPAKRSRPLIAANFVASGMPGGTVSTSTVSYGIRNAAKGLAAPSAVSMLSRNRITQNDIIRKLDFQAGLMLSLDITRHFGIETGLQYTRLASTSVSTSGSMSSSTQEKTSYIGVPVHVIYSPLKLSFMSVYLSAGPEIEYGLSRKWDVYEVINSAQSLIDGGIERPGDWVLSASLNAGVQLQPFRHGAFFVQPGVVYRHCWDSTPASYYTDHPVSFRLSAGYRINF